MKNKMPALAVAVCMFAFAGAALPADVETVVVPTASARMDSARTAIRAGNWRLAVAELNLAVRDEPGNADIHNLLGYSYRKQASPNLAKAFEHYRTALRLNPQHKGAHEYIGEAYLMDKKPAEAEKHLAALEKLCGNKTCEEYTDLAKAIAAYRKP